MGKVFDSIDDSVAAWIEKQKLFFVASAPLSPNGHVNLSPKGMDSFRVLDAKRVAYLDLTGSGIETIAHLRENGRITVMFCAFEGPPQIIRLYGRGLVREPGSERFDELAALFPSHPGKRAVIEIEVSRVSTSCGFAVPFFDFTGERETLIKYTEQKGEEAMREYRCKNNLESIDGLPGLEKPQ